MKLSELPFGATFVVDNCPHVHRIGFGHSTYSGLAWITNLETGAQFHLSDKAEVKPVEILVVKKDDYDKLSRELQDAKDKLSGADIFAGAIGDRLAERDRKIAELEHRIRFMKTYHEITVAEWKQAIRDADSELKLQEKEFEDAWTKNHQMESYHKSQEKLWQDANDALKQQNHKLKDEVKHIEERYKTLWESNESLHRDNGDLKRVVDDLGKMRKQDIEFWSGAYEISRSIYRAALDDWHKERERLTSQAEELNRRLVGIANSLDRLSGMENRCSS